MNVGDNPFSALKPNNFRPRNAKSYQQYLRYYYNLPIVYKTEFAKRDDKLVAAEIRREDIAAARAASSIDVKAVADELDILPESFRPHRHEGPKQFIDRIRRVSQIEMSISMKQAEIQRLNQEALARLDRLKRFEYYIRMTEGTEEARLKKRDDDLISASTGAQSSSLVLERCKQQRESLENVLDGILMEIQRETSRLQHAVEARTLILHVAEIGSTSGGAKELLARQTKLEAWFEKNIDMRGDLNVESLEFSQRKRVQSAGASHSDDVFRLLNEEPVLRLAREKYHLADRMYNYFNFDFKQYVEGLYAYIKKEDVRMPRMYSSITSFETRQAEIPHLNIDKLKSSGTTTQITSSAISRNSSRLSNDFHAATSSALKTSRTSSKQKVLRPPKLEPRAQQSQQAAVQQSSIESELTTIVSGMLANEPHLVFERLNINQSQIDFRISQAISALRQSADLNPVTILSSPVDFAQNISLLEQQNLVRTQNVQNLTIQVEYHEYYFAEYTCGYEETEATLAQAENDIRRKLQTYKTLYDKDFSKYDHAVEAFIYDFSQFREPDEIRLDRLETELTVIDSALIQAGVLAQLIPKYDATIAPKSIMTYYEKLMNSLENYYVAVSYQTKDMARRELGKLRREQTRAAKAREFYNAGRVNEEKARVREERMKRQQVRARKTVPRCYVAQRHKTQAQLELEERLKVGAVVNQDEQDFYV